MHKAGVRELHMCLDGITGPDCAATVVAALSTLQGVHEAPAVNSIKGTAIVKVASVSSR